MFRDKLKCRNEYLDEYITRISMYLNAKNYSILNKDSETHPLANGYKIDTFYVNEYFDKSSTMNPLSGKVVKMLDDIFYDIGETSDFYLSENTTNK